VGLALGLALAVGLAVAAPEWSAEGQMTWAVHVSLAPVFLDPADTPGLLTPFMVLYALHDGLSKPMPGSARAASLAEARGAPRGTASPTRSPCGATSAFTTASP
jgi:peptide/nickel transport system substrate-binding protein